MDQKQKIARLYEESRSSWKSYVFSLARQLTEMDAEDIVQGTMAAVVACLNVGQPIHNLTGYIYRSLRNAVTDWLRKDKASLSLDGDEPRLMDLLSDTAPGPEERLVKKERIERLYAAIDALSPEKREILIATEMMGYTHQALSDAWDIPVGTLLARKHRAIRDLQKILQRKEHER
jgi:RNA polymerase sigma factor (sigma-70 family)